MFNEKENILIEVAAAAENQTVEQFVKEAVRLSVEATFSETMGNETNVSELFRR